MQRTRRGKIVILVLVFVIVISALIYAVYDLAIMTPEIAFFRLITVVFTFILLLFLTPVAVVFYQTIKVLKKRE